MDYIRLFFVALSFAIITSCACTSKKTMPNSTARSSNLAAYLKSEAANMFVQDSLRYLLPTLDSIILDDQRYRADYYNYINEQEQLDSVNMIRLKPIFKRYGWLGIYQIGIRVTHIVYVLVHADMRDKDFFMPFLLDGYRKGTLTPLAFYTFIDSYLQGRSEAQLFGTQMTIDSNVKAISIKDVYPVYDPANIQKRWTVYGNPYTRSYAAVMQTSYKMTWNVAEYEKYVLQNCQKLKISLDSTTHINRMLHLLDSCKALMGKNNTNLR